MNEGQAKLGLPTLTSPIINVIYLDNGLFVSFPRCCAAVSGSAACRLHDGSPLNVAPRTGATYYVQYMNICL